MTALTIQLPAPFKPLLEVGSDVRIIMHPAVNCRTEQVAAALALAHSGENLIISAFPDSISWVLQRWLGKAERETLNGITRLVFGNISVWIAREAEPLRRVPVTKWNALVVHGAQELQSNPLVLLRGRFCSAVVMSEPVNERHWVAFAAKSHTTLHVPNRDLVAAFPDLADVLSLDEKSEKRVSFPTFCRTRLKVRTAKPPEYLTPRQLAEAEKQYGADWFTRRQPPVVTFELSRAQRRVEAMERLGRRKGFRKFLVLKPRRVGETIRNLGKNYDFIARVEGATVLSLADQQARAVSMFDVVKKFAEYDPSGPAVTGDNTTALHLANGSAYYVGTAGGAAPARSLALQRVHGFEVAYWCSGPNSMRDVELVVAGLQEAAQTGEMLFESTPNGREWFCTTYREAKAKLNDWWPIFIRWFDDPTNAARPGTFNPEEIRDTLTDDEKELVKLYSLTHAQIAFRRLKKRGLKKLFDQEFPEDDDRCFLSSGLCYFDTDILAGLMKKSQPYERKHIPGGYSVVWEEPKPGEEYVIGADTSEGLPGCDLNGFGILRRSNCSQVAAVHGYFKPQLLAKLIHQAHLKYNKALVGVERENHGHAVLLELRNLGLDRPLEHGGHLYYHGEGKPGWSTNAVTRPIMLNELAESLEDGMVVRDHDLISECGTFRLQSSGKFEADSGAHDDAVMKWAVALQMLKVRRHKPGITIISGSV